MITLYTFGPAFGLPDPSTFVTKAEVLLKLAGADYRTKVADVRKAPKGKLPYIDDDGTVVADSTFIRMHLEDTRGIDFDAGLNAEQRGVAWAVEKMLEDQLYWAIVDARWTRDADFDHGPRQFFDAVPALARPLVVGLVRRQVKRDLRGQGFGRHTRAELERLAMRSVASLADVLGTKPFLMGDEPCGADASAFASVLGLLCPHFENPIRDGALRHANLVAYRERGLARWFPNFKAA